MLKIKWDINQQYLKTDDLHLSNLNNFHSLEVVDRVSETQLQVGENSNGIIWRLKGWRNTLYDGWRGSCKVIPFIFETLVELKHTYVRECHRRIIIRGCGSPPDSFDPNCTHTDRVVHHLDRIDPYITADDGRRLTPLIRGYFTAGRRPRGVRAPALK